MLTAAIVYCMDQDEPSAPLLLKLDCPDNPTKAEFEEAAKKEAADRQADECQDDNGAFGLNAEYGDWGYQIEYDEGLYLIVRQPEQFADA